MRRILRLDFVIFFTAGVFAASPMLFSAAAPDDAMGRSDQGGRTRGANPALGSPSLGVAADADNSTTFVLPSMPKVSPPPQPPTGLAEDVYLDKQPPRKTVGLNLVKLGWTYDCMECHRHLEARWHYDRPMAEHQDIHLEHGNNRFCLNCHHPTNRNAFVDYDGSEIAEKDVVLLCAKCHGPVYRDWKAGAHGRRNGYWNTAMGPQTRLRCIQCHDPHRPAFQPLKPLPPPSNPKHAPGSATPPELAAGH